MKKKKWKFKKNNKGFTMVEVLAAVVIMGLLAGIAIISVSAILDKAEKNHYETQQKNMIMATQSYVQDNRNILPKEIGGSKIVMLSELQNRKYIGDVLDRSKLSCSNGTLDEGGSYVEIFRYSKDGYSYRPYLKCRNYETGKEEYGGEGPTISLTLTRNYDNPSFSYEITDTEGKIISYSYVIYKHGVLVRDSGSVSVSRVGSLPKKEVSLKDLVPGEFKIIFTSTNMYGKVSTKTIEGVIEDNDGPTCGDIYPVYTEWQKTPELTVNVGCSDNSGSGCAREIFSETFRYDTDTAFIEISDNLGNKTACEVGVYIDNTPPTKPVINNPYENTWINKSYTINVTSNDATSGIAYYEYRFPNSRDDAEREWMIYDGSRRGENVVKGEYTFETTKFVQERGEYVEIRACDNIGNCSESTKSMIKIDKTAPTCSISRNLNSPNGLNNWYVTEVEMNMNVSNLAGAVATAVASPISYELSTKTTPSYSGMNLNAVQADTSKSGVQYNGYVMDEAGNKGTCVDTLGVYLVDVTPPSCTVTKSNTYKTSGVTASFSCSDSSSGVATCASSQSGLKSTYTTSITDKAGNVGECKASISTQTQYRKNYCTQYNRGSSCSCATYSSWSCSTSTITSNATPSSYTYEYSKRSCTLLGGSMSGEHGYGAFSCSTCSRSCSTRSRCYAAGCATYSGWTGWSTGNYCNGESYCSSENRYVYY